MNFVSFFHKSNSSFNYIQGTVLECSIEQIRGNKVILDTGTRASFVCFQDELCDSSALVCLSKNTNQNTIQEKPERQLCSKLTSALLLRRASNNQLKRTSITNPNSQKVTQIMNSSNYIDIKGKDIQMSLPMSPGMGMRKNRKGQNPAAAFAAKSNTQLRAVYCSGGGGEGGASSIDSPQGLQVGISTVIGVEEKRSLLSGEYLFSAPKSMLRNTARKLVWTELSKLSRNSAKNRMMGFILNSVNGGFAVAIAGYIAFLPKSLSLSKKVFIGQWRQFAIIGMNQKIANIVVKEVKMVSALTAKKSLRTIRIN